MSQAPSQAVETDYYELLGVRPDATLDEIRAPIAGR